MTAGSPGTVARILYDAYGNREFEQAAGWIAENAEIVNAATGDRFHGPGGYLQVARGWTAGFPDLQVEIENVIDGPDSAALEYVFRGTHTGALLSPSGFIPPTWIPVELRLCDLLMFRGGKVARITSYLDTATMLRQMGLLPNSPLHAANRRASLGLFVTQVDTSVQQRNKAVVHRFVEEVINQKNPAVALSICARDMRWHGGAIGEARDLPRVQSLLASIFSSFPDLNLEILDMIAEEDRVAVRLTMRGTHLGAFRGIPATGRRVSSSGTNTYRVANDRIVEGWWQHDLLEVMQQLDAAPVSARPGP